MSDKRFLYHIHYFRGLAILFILGLHACISVNWGGAYLQKKAALVIFNNGTVLFVFIAGYLFYHLSKDRFNYGDYLKKKFLYVILPYLLVSIPALIDKFFIDEMGDHWWMDQAFGQRSNLGKLVFLLLTGKHMGVMWFIPMISVLYLVSPAIIKFARTSEFNYVAPVIFICGFFTFRFGYYANIGLSLLYFVPVYFFGIWVYKIQDFLYQHARIILILTGGVYFAMGVLEFMEVIPFDNLIRIRDGYVGYEGIRLNYNKVKMMIMCIFALLLFYQMRDRKINVLKLLGDYSFGIFFVHLYVIEILRLLDRAHYIRISPTNFIIFVIYYLFIAVVTFQIVKLVKFVLKDKSRYFVGS